MTHEEKEECVPVKQPCADCGSELDVKRGKICKACRDFVKAFTPNKYGEYQ